MTRPSKLISIALTAVTACGISLAASPVEATTTVTPPVKTLYDGPHADLASCLAERDAINAQGNPADIAAISCAFYSQQANLPIPVDWGGPGYYLKVLISLA